MRRFRRILLRLLLVALVLYLGRGLWLDMLERVFGIETAEYEQTDASFVYRLDNGNISGDGLVFSFPPSDSLRLIVNGVVPKESILAPGESFAYELHYTLFDRDNEIILEKIYHQSATKTHYRHRNTGRQVAVSFLAESGDIPMDGQVMLINFRGMEKQARRIHIKIKGLRAPLHGAYIRVYWQKSFPDSRLNTRWRRTSRETQKRLARGNIYPVDLLSGREKRRLAENKWEVLAPRGVRGEDFQRTTLYTVRPEVIEATLRPVYPGDRWSGISPDVLYIGAGKRGLVPLPMAGGGFRFTFTRERTNDREPWPETPANISITWYGARPGETETFSVGFPGNKPNKSAVEWERELKGGLLEISSPLEISVKAVQLNTDKDDTRDITPEPVYLKTYLCDVQSSPQYRVFPLNGEGVPVRVDLRGVGNERLSMNGEQEVRCELLDGERQVVAVKELRFQPGESLYDRVVRDLYELTEKSSFYFQVDASVSFLRFKTNGAPVLVSLYNRPPGLVKPVRVPRDSFAFERRDKSIRDWFLLKPLNYTELEQRQRTVLLVVQGRPPQWDFDLLAGNYQWRALYPVKPANARLRRIFLERDSLTEIREKAKESIYEKIPIGKTGTVTLSPGKSTVKMIWINRTGKLSPLSVFLERKLFWRGRINHSRGRVSLPALSPGRYRIRVETDKAIDIYMTPADIDNRMLYQERLALLMEPGGCTFIYPKEEKEERLNLRLFSPIGTSAPCRVDVEIRRINREKGRVLSQWTLAKRTYTVKPAGGPSWPVLDTRNQQTDRGQSLFFPLGEDIKPGTYEVKVKSSTGYYLSAARLVPGNTGAITGRQSKHLQARIKQVKRKNAIYDQFFEKKPGFKEDYHPATAIELKKARRLFALLLKGRWDAGAGTLARGLGYALVMGRDNNYLGKEIAMLRALPEKRRGWGLYFFRREEAGTGPVLVQAPHGGSDLMTGTIGLKLFKDHHVTALALNTAPRSKIDLAHSEATLFQELTGEFARAFPGGRILQVHGFANEKRTSDEGKKASIIISNGTHTPPPLLVTVTDCLNKSCFSPALLYPRDVKELGGTTNNQKKLLKKKGFEGFLHIEINHPFRRRLTENYAMTQMLLDCLIGYRQNNVSF